MPAMRRNQLLLAPLFLGLAASVAACQIDSGEFREGDLGSTQQASIGGTPAQGQDHYEAVAAITILLPSGNDNTARTKYRYCTGVLIEERTVMTVAECLKANLAAELDSELNDSFLDGASIVVQFGASISGSTEYILDATFDEAPTDVDEAPMTLKGLTMHRYFDAQPQNDIALLRLSESPGITPVPVRSTIVGQELVGQTLELVGYGKADGAGGDEEAFTSRSVIVPDIASVTSRSIKAGTTDVTTCYADSGGPGFIDFGDGPEVVTLTARQAECDANVNRQRVDIHVEQFLEPFIKFVSGGCADGACDDCEYNGVCKEDCPTRDWDCSLGSFAGKECAVDGDCEEQGACVPASDDPDYLYCDKPCNPEEATSCPSGMTCNDETRCIYEGITPGSQGAACTTPGECRSGFCENSTCAFECDDTDPDACDGDSGYFCLASLADNTTMVCRTELRDGGGGFCHAASSPHMHDGERNSLLAGLGLLFLFAVFRRKRTH